MANHLKFALCHLICSFAFKKRGKAPPYKTSVGDCERP
jgi:hypothetical protein